MSQKLYSDERLQLHQDIDKLLDMGGVKGFELSLFVYRDKGCSVLSCGSGKVIPEESIHTALRLLANRCLEWGTENSLAMLPVIGTCIDYLDRLYEKSHGEETSPAPRALEVVQ